MVNLKINFKTLYKAQISILKSNTYKMLINLFSFEYGHYTMLQYYLKCLLL